jgi:two-component system LytT family sensor kinase
MGELLNLVGLSMGVVLYAMLLAMVLRAGRARGAHARFDPLLLATAILGLVWNLCALPAYELPKVGILGPFPLLVALGFSALGFLPAVVVHSVLRGERDGVRGGTRRSLAALAYAVSAVAATLHLAAAFTGATVPSALGMRLLTYAFVAIVVPLAGMTRGQPRSRRALWAAALATFAVSALHLSHFHQGDASWPVELVGHHASLPLAFAILYQDYPFALADLFLKRALALLAIVTMAFAVIVTFSARSTAFAQFMQLDPRQVGVLVTLWVATALLYPALAKGTSWFVDAVILKRPDYRSLKISMTRRIQGHDEVPALMADVCAALVPALSSSGVAWREWHADDADPMAGGLVVARGGALAAMVIVPATEAPQYAMTISPLTGGRRLLSDDLATLEAIAVVVARRIDAIRMTRERYERQLREQEMSTLATEAELRALRAQINPHFLFNALTTIGYLVKAAPDRAVETLMRLTSLLRGVLRSEGEFTTLGRELEVIESYLEIEHARFEERLNVRIDVPPELRHVRVPPLLLQPVVENAIKHGIATQRLGGDVTVSARFDDSGRERVLSLVVRDSAGSTQVALARGRATGVGLRNIERRLAAQYGPAASLTIQTSPGAGTTVEIRLPADAVSTEEGHIRWKAR